ncbi:polyphosphate kinase [Candidatus Pantoea carbekii]|uniref:Polyphosphate kinase n=1 Tax=Candidatus Pantoea carbekii TaxID=1235990 RepID=U3U7I4_9GAMM|nr:polyphosphate kinase [Candidatus Pantoea carbekii]
MIILNLAIEIIYKGNIRYALLKIPSDKVTRFVHLPSQSFNKSNSMILLDNILRYCLDEIFNGFFNYDILNAFSMKMTRDSEYDLVTEMMESSLLELMSSKLKQPLKAQPVRFVYQSNMPSPMIKLLCHQLSISNYNSVVPGSRYHNFKDFIKFPNIGKKSRPSSIAFYSSPWL